MDYKQKYLKYKNKYLALKQDIYTQGERGSIKHTQVGGYRKEIINSTNGTKIIIENRQATTAIELQVNKINIEKMDQRNQISGFLFDQVDGILSISDRDFKIINILSKPTETLSEGEKDFLDDLFNRKKPVVSGEVVAEKIDDEEIIKDKYINYRELPDPFRIPELSFLFNLLFSTSGKFTNTGIASYFLNRPELIDGRLNFLKTINPNPVKKFNEEKKMFRLMYNEINEFFKITETILIKDLVLDYSRSNNHMNTGILTSIDHPYFYKKLDSFQMDIFNPVSLLKNYKFIFNCHTMNIDGEYPFEDYNYRIHFVSIPLRMIISIKDDLIEIGYLMEIVVGDTIKDIKRKDAAYWEACKDLIKASLHSMVDALTKRDFLINDFNDDNVMWNKDTNTITYIDITITSFNRKDEALLYNDLVHITIDSL